jgi:polysaccharide biosynthesis/export protein
MTSLLRPTRLARALLSLAVLFAIGGSALGQYMGPATVNNQPAAAPITTDQAVLYPSVPDTTLRAGDGISVRLFGDQEYTFSGRISVDGTVLLPLLGVVTLQGMTISGAEQFIAQQLEAAGMYRDPQVILTLTEGQNAVITVAGEMHGVLPTVGSRTLYSVIASAGGLPNTASRVITILRPAHAEPISIDLGNDPVHSMGGMIPVFPGDTVLVSHLGVIYVAGEFRTPGTVQMTNYGPLTLSQVSAMVGGPVWDARYGELHIIRTVGDHRTVTTLNIKDVLYGKKADPIMQPNDIVFLPPSPIKSSLANGSLGSVLGVVSFALATFYTLR